jgi:ABC-type multidrug transport system fused ATPase/permease subunit
VYDPEADTARDIQVTPGKLGLDGRMLVSLATAIPEPADYSGRFPMLVWLLVLVFALVVGRNVFRFFHEYLVQTSCVRAMIGLRRDCYHVALRLPLTYYSSHGTSDTMSRFVQDTHILQRGQVALFGKTLVEPAKAVASIALAMYLSWKLTLIAAIGGPPAFVLIRTFGKLMKRASRRALESWSRMLAILEETLVGIRVVKAYTMESAERKRFHRVNRRLLKEQDRIARIDAATPPAIESLGLVAALVAAGIAGYFVLNEMMDPFVFITWMGCLAAMFDPVRKLSQVFNRFHQAEAAAARIFEMQDRPVEPRVPNAPKLPAHRESLQFRGVSFRYPEASSDALRDVCLTIRAGQTVAIVGPNGSGKTTLVSLVPRLLDPTGGAVLIDGHDISAVSLRSLRRQIGVVTQDAVLFNATIEENISYGLRSASKEDVLSAARRAFVDEFVRDLPEGYDTMVGEHGATLSGGQKQRITIARAILRDPTILIFDEAMSQIDADSERKIHQAMEEFVRGRTTLMIAHRFATVLSADRIAVLDAGRVADVGTHEELLERCDVYRHLYRTQFVDSGGA